MLGRGTQALVYLAQDPDLHRKVAIKLVAQTASGAQGEEWAQARNLAQLRHPNIIALHEVGKFKSFTYLVFEYLEGTLLREELSTSCAQALPKAYSTILQVTDAMAYAHNKGIVHLDLSPNNIMRDEAVKPRVMDFDLSRMAAEHTGHEVVAGTLPCMAPEHFREQKLDSRTDIYAMGQIFYELLTGQMVVPAGEQEAMIARILSANVDLTPLRQVDPQGHFTALIARATQKDSEQRYANATQMREALIAAWDATANSVDDGRAAYHGTAAFVLRRIERRGDFPAVSRTLSEINELTSSESQSSVSRLSAVMLRANVLRASLNACSACTRATVFSARLASRISISAGGTWSALMSLRISSMSARPRASEADAMSSRRCRARCSQ